MPCWHFCVTRGGTSTLRRAACQSRGKVMLGLARLGRSLLISSPRQGTTRWIHNPGSKHQAALRAFPFAAATRLPDQHSGCTASSGSDIPAQPPPDYACRLGHPSPQHRLTFVPCAFAPLVDLLLLPLRSRSALCLTSPCRITLRNREVLRHELIVHILVLRLEHDVDDMLDLLVSLSPSLRQRTESSFSKKSRVVLSAICVASLIGYPSSISPPPLPNFGTHKYRSTRRGNQ